MLFVHLFFALTFLVGCYIAWTGITTQVYNEADRMVVTNRVVIGLAIMMVSAILL